MNNSGKIKSGEGHENRVARGGCEASFRSQRFLMSEEAHKRFKEHIGPMLDRMEEFDEQKRAAESAGADEGDQQASGVAIDDPAHPFWEALACALQPVVVAVMEQHESLLRSLVDFVSCLRKTPCADPGAFRVGPAADWIQGCLDDLRPIDEDQEMSRIRDALIESEAADGRPENAKSLAQIAEINGRIQDLECQLGGELIRLRGGRC